MNAKAWAPLAVAAIALATAKAGRAEPAQATAGNDSLPEHAEDVASYTLYAALNPVDHTVNGSGTIRWRNTSLTSTRELWVHLYMNAFKNARSAFLRERGVGGRGAGLPHDFGSNRGARADPA